MFKNILPILILILLATGGILAFMNFNPIKNIVKQGSQSISTIPDRQVIITQVKSLNRIETISEDVQREFDLKLDFGELKIFGVSIENRKDQRFQVSGKVIAGIDTSKIKDTDIEIIGDNLTIRLPAPEIFSTELAADKLAILNNSSTLLYKIQNFDSNKNREADEKIKKEAIAQAQKYLSEGACENGISIKANENAKKAIQELYARAGFTVTLIVQESQNCQNLTNQNLF